MHSLSVRHIRVAVRGIVVVGLFELHSGDVPAVLWGHVVLHVPLGLDQLGRRVDLFHLLAGDLRKWPGLRMHGVPRRSLSVQGRCRGLSDLRGGLLRGRVGVHGLPGLRGGLLPGPP